MSNPYLPNWEYIPDGEPRVFGDRVYIYGSHDKAGSDRFCDTKLKVWSAPVSNPTEWICHGDSFLTASNGERDADADWTDGSPLFAPDVVEKDGKYYLYAYIEGQKGCVAVSDKPEGPFKVVSQYEYNKEELEKFDHGIFIDPGVLVDDDGRVYIYCGYLHSYAAEVNPDNMYEIIEGTVVDNIIPEEAPFSFFEACSPRKVGDTYYLIYSSQRPSCLVYATSKSPLGPYTYQGVIIDNGIDYPGGNDHGSICKVGDQWYIFYHRMTNGTIMSRRGCVEKIQILEDGSIPQVEMTSLGFEDSLNPYQITDADIACVLKGGCLITEKDIFSRVITNITDGCVIGYKYFDFGPSTNNEFGEVVMNINGMGCKGKIHICIDGEDGEEIGCVDFGMNDGVIRGKVKAVTGMHSVFFKVEAGFGGGFVEMFKGRQLFELKQFVFSK